MRRIVCVIAILMLLLVSVVPAMAADLAGGYYIVADCVLGKGVKLYVPAGSATGAFTYDDNGYLFNLTGSSIYLYSPDYPNYTIYAPRFDVFQYRSGSGYDYADMKITNVTDANVEIYDADPPVLPSSFEQWLVPVVVLLCICGAIIICRR